MTGKEKSRKDSSKVLEMNRKTKSILRRFLDLLLKWMSILLVFILSQIAIETIMSFWGRKDLTGTLNFIFLFLIISIFLSLVTMALPSVQKIIDVMFGEE